MLTALLDDLRAEQEDLATHVARADLALAVPAEPWDVRDTVTHLLVGDEKALLAATDPGGFAAELPAVVADPHGFVDAWLLVGRDLSREQLTTRWYDGLLALTKALEQVEPGTRIPWYGPPMSPASFATARLMEYWAHGQDVVDALGVRRQPTARLRHICHLGYRTRGFSYAVRGLEVPEGEVRVTLSAPDGAVWEWGAGDDAVLGTAEDFCLRVTQRRHRSDTRLVATGPLADDWLDKAQCFAGLPTDGREPSA
ncbi:MAG TPA: TIGR03084 family metal-binding protein [Mycobacteriales bacterium]|nr:TIGR03084 family metal-binding protein [Mycobacteriales bacterium]